MVEQQTENLRVGGSIPSLATNRHKQIQAATVLPVSVWRVGGADTAIPQLLENEISLNKPRTLLLFFKVSASF